MYEQNNTPSDESTAQRQDAIDINDFVFAATGARVRRLTTQTGEHWFPAMDVAKQLGYANTRDAVQSSVSQQHATTFGDIARSVGLSDARRNTAGHGFRTTMKLVNLQGLIQLVQGCTKPESQPFRTWVSEVIATVQRDGSYSLEPSLAQTPGTGTAAYAMPHQVADAIVRLEERNIQADELMLTLQKEHNGLLRQISHSLQDIAHTLRHPAANRPHPTPVPKLTPQQLLATWKSRNLVVTDDIHAVAAYLAPALVHGEASYRVEEIASRTGLPQDRVLDCLRMLLKRGCMRQTGCASDGAPVYVLP